MGYLYRLCSVLDILTAEDGEYNDGIDAFMEATVTESGNELFGTIEFVLKNPDDSLEQNAFKITVERILCAGNSWVSRSMRYQLQST